MRIVSRVPLLLYNYFKSEVSEYAEMKNDIVLFTFYKAVLWC